MYMLTLQACTRAGCAHSAPQPVHTAEAPPRSQAPPAIRSVGPTSVELSWSEPVHPNGKMTHYEVIRRCFAGSARGNGTDAEIVCTEDARDRDAFACSDTGLQPWTPCEYKIHAWNSAGHACSPWTAVRTGPAPPEGLSPPAITLVSAGPPTLLIAWLPPEQPNGIVQSYRLHRSGAPRPLRFDALTFSYTDAELLPFSTYSYVVTACASGGCGSSEPAHTTTPEAAPAGVHPPGLRAISATQINASWSPPAAQNGRITEYLLRGEGQEHPAGQGLSLLVAHLQPDTRYSFSLVACTRGGCTASAPTSARTLEAPPQNMDPPQLQVTGSESIEVTWAPPRNPNGQVRSYELRRDGAIVYTGLETRFHDFTLTPGVEYGYTVTASNSQGAAVSPLVKDRTSSSAPSGMGPPILQARGPQEIAVAWDPPVRTYGQMVNYTLFVQGLLEGEARIVHINASHPSFGARALAVNQLQPFRRWVAPPGPVRPFCGVIPTCDTPLPICATKGRTGEGKMLEGK